ncbi:MAG: hypothetical protein K2K45_00170 [Muribaculaceae bacterium]|nr:hypothetical protein [Muribaculaceae bacterium]
MYSLSVIFPRPFPVAKVIAETILSLFSIAFSVLISGRPQTGNVFLDDKMYYPVWEALTEVDLPVYIHPNYTSVDAVNAYYKGLNDQLDRYYVRTAMGGTTRQGCRLSE